MRYLLAGICILISYQMALSQIKVDKLEQSIKNDISTNKVGRNDLKGFIDLQKIYNDRDRIAIEANAIYASNFQRMGEGAYKFAIAAYSNKMLDVLNYEFARIINVDRDFDRIRLDIQLKINLVLDLKSGQTNRGVWVGLDCLFRNTIPATILREQLSRKVPELPATDFKRNHITPEIEFLGGNVGEFLEFLKINDFSTKPYSKAHFILLDMFAGFDLAAQDNIQHLEQDIERIRKVSLPVFRVPEIR